MTEAIAQIRTVVINTTDPVKLAEFWKALLGVEEAAKHDEEFLWLRKPEGADIGIAFQKVSDPTPGRRRLHLDTKVDDLARATEKILELGGAQVETHTIGDFTWQVMADPDGNEFCIAAG